MLFTQSSFLLALLTTVCGSATPTSDELPLELKSLLAQADRVALHSALHESHASFVDGSHENDMAAVQAVHRESPALATQILRLARRQNNATATPATTQAPTSGHSSVGVYVTTYTQPDGMPVTLSLTSVVAVGVAGQTASAGSGAAATTSARQGSVQSRADNTIYNPWADHGLRAAAAFTIAGVLGLCVWY